VLARLVGDCPDTSHCGAATARQTDGDRLAELPANCAFGVDRRIGAVADLRHSCVLAGPYGIEFDDTGRRIAAEQRALRPAKHFHPVDVERREALQDRVFQNDVVID
jgi:hypothetical protein